MKAVVVEVSKISAVEAITMMAKIAEDFLVVVYMSSSKARSPLYALSLSLL